MKKICKNCNHFYRITKNKRFNSVYFNPKEWGGCGVELVDVFDSDYFTIEFAHLVINENFGCIHWERKE